MAVPVRLSLILASGAVALAIGVGGASAVTPVTLALHGGHGTRSSVICGVRHQYARYHLGDRVRFDGAIPGVVGAFKVRIKIKQCTHGRYVTRSQTHVRGLDGHFAGSFRVATSGFYSVRAYYSGQTSAKRYLRVS